METFSGTTSVFFFRFYILCENFSKIGPITMKIPKFSDDPLKTLNQFSKFLLNSPSIEIPYAFNRDSISFSIEIP